MRDVIQYVASMRSMMASTTERLRNYDVSQFVLMERGGEVVGQLVSGKKYFLCGPAADLLSTRATNKVSYYSYYIVKECLPLT